MVTQVFPPFDYSILTPEDEADVRQLMAEIDAIRKQSPEFCQDYYRWSGPRPPEEYIRLGGLFLSVKNIMDKYDQK